MPSRKYDGCKSPLFGGFLNKAGPDTASADIKLLYPAVANGSNTLKVRVKPPFIHIVGMTHVIAHQRTFSAYIAYFGHFQILQALDSHI